MKQLALSILLAPCIACSQPIPVENQEADRLPESDRKLFQEMFRLGLLDPTGLRRVRGKVEVRTCWGELHTDVAPGWIRGDRMILDNLREVKAPAATTPVDLAAEARRALDAPPGEKGELPSPAWADDDQIVPFVPVLRYLYWASWLYKTGRFALSQELLSRVRKEQEEWHPTDESLLEAVARDQVAQEYNQTLYALMFGADDEAEAHCARFEKLEGAADFADGKSLIADMNRRKSEGTLRRPVRDPKGLSISELIKDLDQVRVRPWFDGIAFPSLDARVQALITHGEAAIPALLDCIEKDMRYTRCIEFGRSHVAEKSMVPVRYAAETALEGILAITEFPEVPFTRIRGDLEGNRRRESAAALRSYWAKYGALPFSDRMMKMLNDPETPTKALRQAAQNIAFVHRKITFDQPEWTPRTSAERAQSHPAIEKYDSPTAAQAILNAHDRDPQGESEYFRSLVELNDVRVVPELVRRSRFSKTGVDRARYAEAAFRLGDRDALSELAMDVKAGRVKDEGADFFRIVTILVDAADPVCDSALDALTAAAHAKHATLIDLFADPYKRDWWDHPFCFKFMRQLLEDDGFNNWTWTIDGESLVRLTPGPIAIVDHTEIPPCLRNPADRQEKCKGRRKDNAMRLLQDHVWGFPLYHPLRRDADGRVAEAKRLLDLFGDRFRKLTPAEEEQLGPNSEFWRVRVPAIVPLGRLATARDVAEGRAIFHQEGKGKSRRLDRHGAYLKGTRTPVVILQCEVSASGEILYGIVGEGLLGPRRREDLDFSVPK